MYQVLLTRFRETLAQFIRERYSLALPPETIAIERPPRVALGEMASPVAFELARRLRRAPRELAREISTGLGPVAGIDRLEVAGAGYLNAHLDRGAFLRLALDRAGREAVAAAPGAPKTIVEHTNINPNKAAHIGHLRNAALGDSFVRLLRYAGRRVEVQNYIDNTGVQVADVVLGFLDLEKKSPEEVGALAREPGFDVVCWDLYARVTQFLLEDPGRLALRARVLQAIEEGRGAAAETAETISTAITRCHLRTMDRLGIEYDLLPRESEILHLKFWEAAFEQLVARGAITKASAGKNAGCWVMALGEKKEVEPFRGRESAQADGSPPAKSRRGLSGTEPAGESAAEGEEAEAKVIVRSDGTVTYVGKDIAYQLWKFGLLGRDFHYRRFHTYPTGHTLWTSCPPPGEPGAPAFGRASEVHNVIDSRQAYLQAVVVAGLRALGFAEQAAHSVHFAYEMVALSPRCAREMGFALTEEDARRPYVEVSGRKGLGVRADDLLDRLEAASRAEVDARHPDQPPDERARMAHAIAIGALRYFLLKYTRNTVIAFDFKDALSFEGETGPYVQYAVVRARNIFRKLLEREPEFPLDRLAEQISAEQLKELLAPPAGDDLWELALLAGSLGAQVEAAVAAQEPAFIAKYAFQLAQAFNLFYHKHRILPEPDPARRALLLILARLVERQLVVALELLGIEAPERM
jgi:arginyl-tRNA synthetase